MSKADTEATFDNEPIPSDNEENETGAVCESKEPVVELIDEDSEQQGRRASQEEAADEVNESLKANMDSIGNRPQEHVETVAVVDDPYLKELEQDVPEPPDVFRPMTFECPFDYLVCIDLRLVQTSEPRMIVHQEQIYIKPIYCHVSDHCTRMTGVKLENVEGGISLEEGIHKLDDFVKRHFVSKSKTFCLVSLSEVDLRTLLVRDAAEKGIELAEYYSRMFSMVKEMNKWLSLNQLSGRKVLGKNSLLGICADLGVEMRSRVPSGLEDALTMADGVMKLLEKVTVWTQRPQGVREGTLLPFYTPVDAKKEWQLFEAEGSRLIHLQGLSYKLTASEVHEWLAKGELKAQQLWMIKNSEGRPDGSAFVVFSTHMEATLCLEMNGRILLDRHVLVSPATMQMFLELGHLKAPFMTNKAPGVKSTESHASRPGDWYCKACKFHNYAHRKSCMNCHKENPSHSSMSSHPYKSGAQTKGAGDWVCGNPSCRFSNYQSRSECMKCKSPRPPGAAAPPGGRARSLNVVNGPGTYSSYSNPQYGASRGHFEEKQGRARPTDRPGDWTCSNPSCRYHNYASRNECYRCKSPKQNSGSTLSGYASPSYPSYGYGTTFGPQRPADYRQTGSLRAGDWLCPNASCRYHNYSKRDTCALCSTPAPKAIATQSSVYSQPPTHASGYYAQPGYDASTQAYYNQASYAGYYQQYGQQPSSTHAQSYPSFYGTGYGAGHYSQ